LKSQHFATAWLDQHLKAGETKAAYLDLVPTPMQASGPSRTTAPTSRNTPAGTVSPTASPWACTYEVLTASE
jgi:hypothetical protein